MVIFADRSFSRIGQTSEVTLLLIFFEGPALVDAHECGHTFLRDVKVHTGLVHKYRIIKDEIISAVV